MSHHCGFCGKDIPTVGGVKRHILGRPQCRKEWEALIAETDAVADVIDDSNTHDNEREFAPDHMLGEITDSFSPLRRTHSPPDLDDAASKIRRVTVEEVEDEDGTYNRRFFESYPNAGRPIDEGKTVFESYCQHKEDEGEDVWAPFADEEEWGLAEWIIKNLGQTRTDEYLKLPIVSIWLNIMKKTIK